ncbi:MAG: ABC-F family ATP-binding cassette domain-containing protein [Chitinophagales bacterium]
MHYLSVEKLGKSYGIRHLFKDISFHLEDGDKVALVAKNGSGKSSLLKILAGRDQADEGSIWINKQVNLVYLEQDPIFKEDETILENIFHLDHPIIQAIKNFESANEEGDVQKLSETMLSMDELDAWNFDAKVKQILSRLHIYQLQEPLKNLSGGQRKRAALARTLIDIGFESSHVLLLLDEPTNHLDIEMVEWLENYLDQEKLSLVLVTHDRYFLDNICTAIWELDGDHIFFWKGGYEDFIEKKSAKMESEQASIDKARNEYRRELEWMRKQPRARTTKSKSREDHFYTVEARAKMKIEDQQIQLQSGMNRLGGKIVELKKVDKKYGEKTILQKFDYNFKKGERVGLVGSNAVGKSTLINIIQGMDQPDGGKINVGDTVIFGYYSQTGLAIKEDMRVIEYVKSIAENFQLSNGSSLSASQFLNLFLFPPDQQYTYLSSLSGGEKRRLHLLSILFRNPNFLILDEPTNDLDLPTLTVLENFLSEFPGCLLIVSHDRYFMDRLVDHVLVMEGNGVIRDFPGNYSQYRFWQKEEELKAREMIREADATEFSDNHNREPVTRDSNRRLSYKEKREFESLELEMEGLVKEKESIQAKFQSGNLLYEEWHKLSLRINEIDQELHGKELRWLELSEFQ